MIVYNATRRTVIATDAEYARSFWRRTWGLIGRTELPAGYGLVFPHCSAVHTLGMRVVLDALYLDARGQVVRALPDLPPWRFGPVVWHSAIVIELPSGTIARTGTQVGDQVTLGSDIPTGLIPDAGRCQEPNNDIRILLNYVGAAQPFDPELPNFSVIGHLLFTRSRGDPQLSPDLPGVE